VIFKNKYEEGGNMARRKKQEPEIPIHVLEDQAMSELSDRMHKILMEYPEDHHEELRKQLEYKAGQEIHEDYVKSYPAWARVYGPKPAKVKSVQFKGIQGNVGLDIEAKKYD
jgi:hypothetical protein